MNSRIATLVAASAAAALFGCAHAPPAATSQEVGYLREEVRRLRTDREQDRRAIRALEAQLGILSRKAAEEAEEASPSGAPKAAFSIPTLAVVRLEPTASSEPEPEPEAEEDSYVFIADGGDGGPRPSSPRRGGPDAAPPLPTRVDLRTSAAPTPAPADELVLAPEEAPPPEFERGLAALRDGDAQGAIELLEGFVSGAPRHSSADNAVLALGEAWLVLGKPGNALQAFERVVREYPAGDVVPEALLRYGETCLEQGRVAAGEAAFQRLVEGYPNSPAAGRAQVHLAKR